MTYAIERLIDKAARELGFDRVELRRMTLIGPQMMPYGNAVGARYDSGEYEANMDLAMRIADWNGFAARRQEARARGRLLGLGLANYVESSIGAPRERTEITVTPAGRVEVVIGTQPNGQGHETSFAQVVSALLRVPVEAIDLITGDTDVVSLGGGSHSGRSMRHAATLFAKAAPELIAKGKAIAACILETTADEVAFEDGRFTAPRSNRSFDFLELAKEAARHRLEDELSIVADNEMPTRFSPMAVPSAGEVDPETAVDYYAVVTMSRHQPATAWPESRRHRSGAQAMWEECAIDPASGQPLSGSFMDYGMPRSDNLPSLKTEIVEVLSPTNPFGIKAGGEGGCTPALAVVVSAILDALAPLGVRDITMPTTPFKVWRAIRDAKSEVAQLLGRSVD